MKHFQTQVLILSLIAVVAPLVFIVIRFVLGIESFSIPIIVLLFIEVSFQIFLFFCHRLGWLNLKQFKATIYLVWFIIGIPTTIICLYSGILPEFRLAPYLILMFIENESGKTIYTFLLLLIGTLAFLPFFQHPIHSLIISGFRPIVIAIIIILYFRLRQPTHTQN